MLHAQYQLHFCLLLKSVCRHQMTGAFRAIDCVHTAGGESVCPGVIHFQCEPAARAAQRVSDGESVEES